MTTKIEITLPADETLTQDNFTLNADGTVTIKNSDLNKLLQSKFTEAVKNPSIQGVGVAIIVT